MMFENLSVQYFSRLKNIDDFNNYVNGLVLLDDLLCSYDTVPRYPEYLPSRTNPKLAGTPELLSEPIRQCINNINSDYLCVNLKKNFAIAQQLYDKRSTMQTEIFYFLAELVRQYSEMVHPAVYPSTVG